MRLSNRITLGIVSILFVVLSITGWLSIRAERDALRSLMDSQAKAITQSLAAYSIEALISEDFPALDNVLLVIGQNAGNIELIEVTDRGRVVARFGDINSTGYPFHGDITLNATGMPPKKLGEVRLLMSTRNHDAIIKTRIVQDLVVSMLFVFLVLILFLRYMLGKVVVQRIESLTDHTEKVIAEELSGYTPPDHSQDEISRLRDSFTFMLSGLQSRERGLSEMSTQLLQERAVLRQRIDEATLKLRNEKEEAERTCQDKSRFLAVASHDLRQPLHALGLYVAELRHQLSFTPQQHLVEQVEQSVDALATLLNALLDISKLDAGAVIPQIQSCDIAAMVTRVAGDYQMLAAIKNIHLVVHPRAGYVSSDPVLLERILTNLVSNAIRYSYPNGCVMIACRKRGNQMRIEIRDNGIGISQADQSNIFREFFQISKPQLDSGKGLGLGLAIVDRLVKLLGISIELRSAPNKGSLFALQVSTSAEPEKFTRTGKLPVFASAASDSGDSLPLSGKSILVVDDDELVLTSTSTILAAWGGQVSTATSLYGVQQLLSLDLSWDLIISDYQLGMNETGIDVIAAVRKHWHNDIPGILISGDTSPDLLQLAHSAGHHLMHKPVKPAKLRSLVMYLLGDSKPT